MSKKINKPLKNNKSIAPTLEQNSNYYLFYGAIVLLCVVCFYNSLSNGITNWDDNKYITNNPLLDAVKSGKISNLFTQFFDGNYHPLALLSLSIDFSIGNGKPFWFHFTNVLLHIFNSILIFKILLQFVKNKWAVLIASLVFAAHTLHVESVTWLSERKDVLYSFFFLLALYHYCIYATTEKTKNYFLSILFFVLALFSKGQAVALAICIPLVDYYFSRKLLSKKVILEKLPYFILAFIFGVVALKAQSSSNYLAEFNFTFFQKIAIASFGLFQYISKTFLPINLSAFYPYPDMVTYALPNYFYTYLLVPVAFITLLFIYRKNKIIVFSLLFFVFNLVLVLQIISVGSAITADRYAYIPLLGFCLLIAYFIDTIQKEKKQLTTIGFAITCVYILFLSYNTIQRNKVWKDSLSLWTDVVAKHKNIPLAYYNLATTQNELGDNANAIHNFTSAIKLQNTDADSYHNRGNCYFLMQRYDSAYTDFSNAIKLKPQFSDSYNNRGLTLLNLKRYEEAKKDFDAALQLDANNNLAYTNRAIANYNLGNKEAACEDWQRALNNGYTDAKTYLEKYCEN
ncbi:MAG: tetratricopeptide repeat protein [Bacteroidota bacterium]